MIASMTGFGKGEASDGTNRIVAEVRAVNSRFCDVSSRLPSSLMVLEPRLKEVVQTAMSRGRIEVTVTFDGEGASNGVPVLNQGVARGYWEGLSRLKEALSLDAAIDFNVLASLPEVFSYIPREIDVEAAWSLVRMATEGALQQCNAMRRSEGRRLTDDLRNRIATLERLLSEVEALAPERLEAGRKRLRERIAEALEGGLSEDRLATEIAILADRLDITEECVRFHSHNEQFLFLLHRDEPVGRRLNFLLQEMGREANTIGSKANDASIAHLVVEMKEDLERLREQVQNVE